MATKVSNCATIANSSKDNAEFLTSCPQIVGKKGKVDVCVLNPKCITLSELYGQLNINTMEWSDGLLSAAVRNFVHISTAEDSKKDSDLGLMSRITDLSNVSLVWNLVFCLDNTDCCIVQAILLKHH